MKAQKEASELVESSEYCIDEDRPRSYAPKSRFNTETKARKVSHFTTPAKKGTEEHSLNYSTNTSARYLETNRQHAEISKTVHQQMLVQRLNKRRAHHKSCDLTAVKPKNLASNNASQNTALLSSTKGNFVKELTVEDVYDDGTEKESTQQGGAREIMKHIQPIREVRQTIEIPTFCRIHQIEIARTDGE